MLVAGTAKRTTGKRSATRADEPLERLERSLSAVLRRLEDRGTLGDLRRRSGYKLSSVSWAVLEHLDALGSMRVSDLAACHGVRTSSIIPRLKDLEAAGLIKRGAHPDDGRVSIINITPDGHRALDSIHAARREALAYALTNTDTDPQAIVIAADVLASIDVGLATWPPAATDAERAATTRDASTRRRRRSRR